MPPKRKRGNATPFGRFLDAHGRGDDYAEVARELGMSRERARQLAQWDYPSFPTAFVIRDWSRHIDPDNFVTLEAWEATIIAVHEAKEASDAAALDEMLKAREAAKSTRKRSRRARS